MSKRKRTRILVVIEADFACYRGLQIGIADFAGSREGWHVDLHKSGRDLLSWIEHTQPTGLIFGPTTDFDALQGREAIRQIPHTIALCSNLSAAEGFETLPEVGVDDAHVGKLAAQHFLGKGFQNFGFISAPASAWWAQQRYEGFRAEVRAAGFDAALWETHYSYLEPDEVLARESLNDWLKAQPKPLALLACNDSRGWECAQACEELSLHIPGEIAILGVDNDDLFCRLCHPALSSVMVPWERLGYQAAYLLDQLLLGKEVAPGMHRVPAAGVFERQSTDVVAVADPDIRAAVQFIRANANRPIAVDDIVDAVPLSRRDLEQRFRKIIKRSPLEEIRSAHLARAKMLLATTDMPIDEVAISSGFASVHWFDKVFKQFVECTPTAYRKQLRG